MAKVGHSISVTRDRKFITGLHIANNKHYPITKWFVDWTADRKVTGSSPG